jgi:hypothetical protein
VLAEEERRDLKLNNIKIIVKDYIGLFIKETNMGIVWRM